MLNKRQKELFNDKARYELQKILKELGIVVFNEETTNLLQETIESKIISMSYYETEKKQIDEELLKIYDIINDIILDNETNYEFLNKLIFDK